ncbi:MAG: protoheme IX farnesyltransferase [Actinobacteria bacterium]|nr:MAG: protoheme IX farnesyltransferase [Actinomycetota bacterium]
MSSETLKVAGARAPSGVLARYLALTKPRIIELLLVTTVPTLFLASTGWPSLSITVITLVGGTFAAASANSFNSIIDRDIDALMERTMHRPMPRGEISVRAAFAFASVLGVISILLLWVLANPLTGILALVAILLYVLGYTIVLKRRTAENIVWGGAAGCMPVLIGWAAVTNSLSLAPIVLFLIIFFWTPPHYWPLAIKYKDEYAAASVPMLPVIATMQHVAKRIVIYSWIMVLVSLSLIPIANMDWLYSGSAVILGGAFIYESHAIASRVKRRVDPKPMRLFHGSITYLSLLFLAVAIDALL